MATIDLGTLTALTLRADMQTPAQFTSLDGLRLNLPGSVVLPPPGEYSTLTGNGITVYGYTRTAPDGSFEWLMTAQQDQVLSQVQALVPGGWTNTTSRDGYVSQAKFLLGAGISGAQLWPGLQNFVSWVIAEMVARGWKAP